MAEQIFIKKLSDDNFTEETKSGYVLVDFFAEWCGPCRMMNPVLEELSQEMHGKVTIAKLDIDNEQKTAVQFQVTSVPTLILFKQGEEKSRLIGLRDADAIREFIKNNS